MKLFLFFVSAAFCHVPAEFHFITFVFLEGCCLNGLPLIDIYSAYSWQPQQILLLMPFHQVEDLSDDDNTPVKVEVACKLEQNHPVPPALQPARGAAKLKAQRLQVQRPGELRGVLGRLVQQVCKCATSKHGRASHHGRQCLRQFRDHVQPLFQLRVRLGQLSKQDMDNEALDFSVIARQLVHHVNPPEILRAIHLVGHVMMCHDMIRELYSSVLIM